MATTGWKEKDDRTIAEMRAYMKRERLDAFIPSKVAHIAYLTNYHDPVHQHILWEEMTCVLVVPRESDAFIVGAHSHFAGAADVGVAPWWLTERYGVGSPGRKVLDDAGALLKEKGLGRGRLGIELKWMPVAVFDYLRAALPDAELVSADLLVPQIRFIKTKREQMLLRKAAETGFRAMEAYMQAIRAGATVDEANRARAKRALEYGAEFVGGPYRTAWTGGNDATPAWWDASARRQFIASALPSRNYRGLPDSLQFWVTHLETLFQYYFSDLAFHELYGPEPDPEDVLRWGSQEVAYREACHDFEVLRRVQTEALQGIRSGMDQWQAKQTVDDYLKSDAEAAGHITGYFVHGVGLEVHEEPVLTARGVCIPTDGPIYYRPGAVVSSEWFTRLWTVEEPFVLTDVGWKPLVELKGIVDPAAATLDPRFGG